VIDFGEDEIEDSHVYAFESNAANEAQAERDSEDGEAIPDEDFDTEDAIKREDSFDISREHMTPERLNGLYAAWVNGQPASATALFKATEGYIYRIVKRYEYEDSGFAGIGTAEEADDFAAKGLMGIWQAITRGRITESYFHFVRSLAYRQRARFLRYLRRQKESRVSFEKPANPEHNDYGQQENEGATVLSPEVYGAVCGDGRGGKWNGEVMVSAEWDEHGNPIQPVAGLLAKFNPLPYLEFIPWDERGPFNLLAGAKEKTAKAAKERIAREHNQPMTWVHGKDIDTSLTSLAEYQQAHKNGTAKVGKPAHWMDNQIAKFKGTLSEYQTIVNDRFDAWRELNDEAVRARVQGRIGLYKAAPASQAPVILPVLPMTPRTATYASAARTVATQFLRETFKRKRVGRNSEEYALLILSQVMAESKLHPDAALVELSIWQPATMRLHRYYSNVYMTLLEHMHGAARNWEYYWTKSFRNALPTMEQAKQRMGFDVSMRVMERSAVREWARKSYRDQRPMSDIEAAFSFVDRHWADIERTAVELIPAYNPAMELVQETESYAA